MIYTLSFFSILFYACIFCFLHYDLTAIHIYLIAICHCNFQTSFVMCPRIASNKLRLFKLRLHPKWGYNFHFLKRSKLMHVVNFLLFGNVGLVREEILTEKSTMRSLPITTIDIFPRFVVLLNAALFPHQFMFIIADFICVKYPALLDHLVSSANYYALILRAHCGPCLLVGGVYYFSLLLNFVHHQSGRLFPVSWIRIRRVASAKRTFRFGNYLCNRWCLH